VQYPNNDNGYYDETLGDIEQDVGKKFKRRYVHSVYQKGFCNILGIAKGIKLKLSGKIERMIK